MRVPLNWMKAYVEFDHSAEWLAERLTLIGLKVEGIERFAADFAGVLIGRIAAVDELGGNAQLRVAQVDLGDRQVQVVSGAPNLGTAAVGRCAPYAAVGARLPGQGDPIGRRTFGGVDSEGMLCSEAELGLGDDHSGIWLLPADAPVGEPLQALLGAAGDVLEFEIYPNRPDCLSVLGIAREVAAVTGAALRPPVPEVTESKAKTAAAVSVAIEAPEQCSRYIARLVEDVTVGPSPVWLQERLRAAGMRSVNNVVDVSNYVM
ncbi:MAG TPA: phenylalanine--tRNA ligase beta subunit-related protein, partial [Limnochordia bacterium]|nr:phenylalanine--tRNA ligase beta subunit-related protein [Limnochordia bacterium]